MSQMVSVYDIEDVIVDSMGSSAVDARSAVGLESASTVVSALSARSVADRAFPWGDGFCDTTTYVHDALVKRDTRDDARHPMSTMSSPGDIVPPWIKDLLGMTRQVSAGK